MAAMDEVSLPLIESGLVGLDEFVSCISFVIAGASAMVGNVF